MPNEKKYRDHVDDYDDNAPLSMVSWKLWSEMVVEWIKGVIREQKRQQCEINDLYKKIDEVNTRVSQTREEVIKSDNDIDREVVKIKGEINKDVDKRGQLYTAVAGIVSIIVGVLFKLFGGA